MTAPHDQPSRVKRIFAPANVLSVIAGIAVFVLGIIGWDTTRGTIVAAVVAGFVAGLVWLIIWTLRRPPDLSDLIGARRLGSIPETSGGPAPTLTEPRSATSLAFRSVLSNLEAHTRGRVVLVAGTSPGSGSTMISLNLAVTATQQGRRVLLVDGDSEGRGLSRFMGSGPEPGLTDLAAGTANLRDASRLWQLDANTVLPILPAGTRREDPESDFAGAALTDALSAVAGKADLVLIDAPPVMWNGVTGPLARQADGSLLVVTESAPPQSILDATERLSDAGAPVIGFVVNRSTGSVPWTRRPLIRMLKRSAAAFVLILIGFAMYTGAQLWNSWRGIERNTFDVAQAEVVLPPIPVVPESDVLEEDLAGTDLETFVASPPIVDEAFRSFLIIGKDAVSAAADVIILVVLPGDGQDPFMVSLPRDLYLPNRCTGGFSRINATIHGCGETNGPTLLSLTVQDFTGIPVDHFAIFDFDGFEQVIDGVGGVEICVEYAVRDTDEALVSVLDLQAGCTVADGAQALAWVRSRHTQQLIDGRWRRVPGTGDLLRNVHQQDVILELFKKLKTFGSPSDLTGTVADLSDAFILDDRLSLTDAIALAWRLRDVEFASINRLEIPVKLARTKEGRSVLLPQESFADVLAKIYPTISSDDGPADGAAASADAE